MSDIVERLRKNGEAWHHVWGQEVFDAARDEIARLQGELLRRPSSEFVELLQDQVRILQDRCRRFEAENKRLTAAFELACTTQAKMLRTKFNPEDPNG